MEPLPMKMVELVKFRPHSQILTLLKKCRLPFSSGTRVHADCTYTSVYTCILQHCDEHTENIFTINMYMHVHTY